MTSLKWCFAVTRVIIREHSSPPPSPHTPQLFLVLLMYFCCCNLCKILFCCGKSDGPLPTAVLLSQVQNYCFAVIRVINEYSDLSPPPPPTATPHLCLQCESDQRAFTPPPPRPTPLPVLQRESDQNIHTLHHPTTLPVLQHESDQRTFTHPTPTPPTCPFYNMRVIREFTFLLSPFPPSPPPPTFLPSSCVEILMYQISLAHSCLYVYKWWL